VTFEATLAGVLASGAALWMFVELALSSRTKAASFGKKLHVIVFVTTLTWFAAFGLAYTVASLLASVGNR
jgi:hypothetical protein